MNVLRGGTVALVSALLWAQACSTTKRTSKVSCDPGESDTCVGENDCPGVRLCTDAAEFGPCVCNAGSGGSAGMAGAGGAAGDSGLAGVGGLGGSGGTGGEAASGGSGAGAGGSSGAAGSGGVAGQDASSTGGAGGTAGGMADAAADSTIDASDSGTCPSLPGPAMIPVEDFCIDQTEVTSEQYKVFLDANPPTSGQPAPCGWNTTYVPDDSGSCTGLWDPVARKDHPVVCVDWCDAFAYCKWAGKRLCGSRQGTAADYFSVDDPAQSRWTAACLTGGAYSYSNVYEPAACNGLDFDGVGSQGTETTRPVGSAVGCITPGGIRDLGGNANEWEDACETSMGINDLCRRRGGMFLHPAQFLRCDTPLQSNRGNHGFGTGIRCCL